MNRLVVDIRVAGWVAEQLEDAPWENPQAAIAVFKDGGLIAGVVYHDYSFNNIGMSIASITPRWAERGTIRAFLHYPFVQLGCRRVTAVTKLFNERSRRFLQGIGFQQEGRLADFFDDQDAIVYGMTRRVAEGRWLGGEIEQGARAA